MRHFIFSLVFFSIVNICYAKEKSKRFTVEGKFEGEHTKTVTFTYNDADSGYVIKKCTILNQRFSFSGAVNEPTLVYVKSDIAANSVDDVNYGEFFIEPGYITVSLREGHFKLMNVSGSKTQDENYKLEMSKANIYKLLRPNDSLLSVYNKMLVKIPKKDSAQSNLVATRRMAIITESQKHLTQARLLDRKFISSHPASFLSPYLLYLQFHTQTLKIDSTKIYFGKLSPVVQNSYWGIELSRRLELLKINETLPNIKGRSIESKRVATAELSKAGYTLVVVWASWCVPCRENMPKLMKIYNKYHPKGLQVIAITADESKRNWLAAIKNDKLFAWQHIQPDQKAGIIPTLGLYGIPAEILLNKGVIIEKYSGASNEDTRIEYLEKKLDQIFTTN
ncbi:DUF4369 domain-containing protein [Mucilaginibacter sp.]|uniref:DUF4369 domain-containing protein n=1 Tax=Mucilaginibacter sp. TaxID=1882438 RepID=UPI003B00646E